MAREIERKFLVKEGDWRAAEGVRYRQGYLNSVKERVVRVRTIGEQGYLAVKGLTVGASRLEFEYEIPVRDAEQMLDELCERSLIEKDRRKVQHAGLVWEIDEFFGENQGLVVCEVELESEDQELERPEWLGEEVTGDPRYFNSNLIRHPYTRW